REWIVSLLAEEERGTRENPGEADTDAGVEVAACITLLAVHRDQRVDVRFGYRPTERPLRHRGQNLCGAGVFTCRARNRSGGTLRCRGRRRGGRLADEQLLARR